VGGGHYYAYIRPNGSVGFDYQTFANNTHAFTQDAHVPNGDRDANTDAAESKGAESEDVDGLSGGFIRASDGPSIGGVGSNGDSVRTPKLTKELLEKQARDGQWFKFNDETVVKVRPFEAINHCFGRNKTNLLGFGSAYMLVYIRESNASEIMAKVTQRDIPSCLTNRLDSIMVQRAEEERKTIKYATEEHVRDFHGYRLEI
jgi:hypothetical protein